MFGLTYFVVFWISYAILCRLWAPPEARLRSSDALPIIAPIAVYLTLEFAVRDRQGFSWFLAEAVIAVPVAIGLSSAPRLRLERPWIFRVIVAIVGSVAAWIAWMRLPMASLNRLF